MVDLPKYEGRSPKPLEIRATKTFQRNGRGASRLSIYHREEDWANGSARGREHSRSFKALPMCHADQEQAIACDAPQPSASGGSCGAEASPHRLAKPLGESLGDASTPLRSGRHDKKGASVPMTTHVNSGISDIEIEFAVIRSRGKRSL